MRRQICIYSYVLELRTEFLVVPSNAFYINSSESELSINTDTLFIS
jgi:hypothetical protein